MRPCTVGEKSSFKWHRESNPFCHPQTWAAKQSICKMQGGFCRAGQLAGSWYWARFAPGWYKPRSLYQAPGSTERGTARAPGSDKSPASLVAASPCLGLLCEMPPRGASSPANRSVQGGHFGKGCYERHLWLFALVSLLIPECGFASRCVRRGVVVLQS